MSHQSRFNDTPKLQYELNYVIKWSLKSLTRPLVCISTLPISYRFISIFDNIDNLIVHPKYSLISLKSSKLCIRYLNVYIEITPFCAKVNWLDLLDIWDGLELFWKYEECKPWWTKDQSKGRNLCTCNPQDVLFFIDKLLCFSCNYILMFLSTFNDHIYYTYIIIHSLYIIIHYWLLKNIKPIGIIVIFNVVIPKKMLQFSYKKYSSNCKLISLGSTAQ